MWSKKLGKTRRNLALLGAFVLVTLLGALVLTAGLVVAVYKRGGFELPDGFFRSRNNPLDGCYHVYLDVGSNIGIQASVIVVIKLTKIGIKFLGAKTV